jgi:hypothetical protein
MTREQRRIHGLLVPVLLACALAAGVTLWWMH